MNTVAARAPAVAAAAPNSPGRYLQRKCSSCGSPSIGGATCRSCAAKPHARNPSAQTPAPQGGQALVPAVQTDMSSRFGHDFSRVRVHTDAAAAASARSLGALAYTSGSDITFSAGRYDPASADGRRLLAHELAHVVQQSGHIGGTQTQLAVSAPGDASERQADAAADAVLAGRAVPRLDALPARIARTCGPAALGAAVPDCAPSSAGVVGHHFLFDVNCDDLKSVEVTPGVFHTGAAAVADFVATVPAGSTINVHGFASGEGDAAFNMDLSCHRANKVATLLRAAGLPVAATFKHGGVTAPPGPDFWRAANVEVVRPDPGPQNVCGPDVTNWLVDQVRLAKADPAVLAVQSTLATAAALAAAEGYSANLIAEGAVGAAVEAQAIRSHAPSTPAFPVPLRHISASFAGQAELVRAGLDSLNPFGSGMPLHIIGLIASASFAWKALVGTGRRYDFKSNVLSGVTSPHCPVNCNSSITLCPHPAGSCFNADVPGNLFYAHIGRFIGFSELSLQLGSQFAQLLSSARWDPPEDTAMISAGFGMAHPMGRATLCSAVAGMRGSISRRACMPCPETGSVPFQ